MQRGSPEWILYIRQWFEQMSITAQRRGMTFDEYLRYLRLDPNEVHAALDKEDSSGS